MPVRVVFLIGGTKHTDGTRQGSWVWCEVSKIRTGIDDELNTEVLQLYNLHFVQNERERERSLVITLAQSTNFCRMTIGTEVVKGSNYCPWCYSFLVCIFVRLVRGVLAAACQRIRCFLKQTTVQLKPILDTFLTHINPLHVDNQSFISSLTPSV